MVVSIFRGPIDLLAYLVRRRQLSAEEVEVAEVVRQFVAFVRAMEVLQIEEAAEFLPVAAALVLWKVRSLLPRSDEDEEEEAAEEFDVEEMFRAAQERAEEYLVYRAAAEKLREARERQQRIFIRSADEEEIETGWVSIEDADVLDMVAALARVLERTQRQPRGMVMRPRWSIRSQLSYVKQRLRRADGQLSFEDLFEEAEDRLWVVVTFLALLELIRRGEVKVHGTDEGQILLRISG